MIAAALDRLWAWLAPDPGPPDLSRLTRRASGNDALIAPADLCPGLARDAEPPVFPVSAERLLAVIDQVALTEPGVARLPSPADQPRYLARTRLLRFPDLVEVRVIARGRAASTLALYSRSLVGRKDFGVNRARLRRWLAAIAREAGA